MSGELLELAERVEAAQASDLEINGDVWWLLKRQRAENEYWRAAMGLPRPLGDKMPAGLGAHAVRVGAPNFTASLDAVIGLASAVGARPMYMVLAAIKGDEPDADLGRIARIALATVLRTYARALAAEPDAAAPREERERS